MASNRNVIARRTYELSTAEERLGDVNDCGSSKRRVFQQAGGNCLRDSGAGLAVSVAQEAEAGTERRVTLDRARAVWRRDTFGGLLVRRLTSVCKRQHSWQV